MNQDNRHWTSSTVYLRNRYLYNLISMIFFTFVHPKRCFRLLKLWLKELWRLSPVDSLRALAHLWVGFGLAREVRHQKIDHLHAHFATASTLALVAHILTGSSFSFTAHASGDIYVYSPFLYEKLRCAKRIIAISEYNKKYLQLISNYEVESSKIEVIYNGVEIPSICSDKTNNNPPAIFMSAAFSGFKGHGTLINALAIIKARKIAFVCRLAGNGPDFHQIESMIAKKNLRDCVEQLGAIPLSAVYNHLQHSDIFVFPSEININGLRDGMPTAITEAMAHGLPVVATSVSGIPDQVTDGLNGFLVRERDERSLAGKLVVLLQDKDLRRRMGANSRTIAAEKFDGRKTMQRVAETLAECCN
jgi:glycosyltransferase involved in cell wall biosynthesis